MTADTISRLLDGFRQLGTYIAAAGYAGVGERTVYDHCESDPLFRRQIEWARAEYALRHALALEKDDSPERHEKALQRMAPREYVIGSKHEVLGVQPATVFTFVIGDELGAAPAQIAPAADTEAG